MWSPPSVAHNTSLNGSKDFKTTNEFFSRIVPAKLGGLNGSTQHPLAVYLLGSQKLNSLASIDANGTLPCLGLIEYSPKDRFFYEKYGRINRLDGVASTS
jgi:hypothetical protein